MSVATLPETDLPTEEAPGRLRESWLTTVDHKKIGILYLLGACGFLVLGGVEALVMRIQLWAPGLKVVDPDTFNRMFTMHGTTMIFFVAMPVVFGFANYVVPLMIGARDMAFPRLNAFSVWLFVLGGLFNFSFFTGGAPDIGWFAYAPLTEYSFSRGNSTDYWILGLLISGIGSVGGAVNLVTTILTMRAPGMKITRIPLFAWMMLFTGFEIILAFPVLTAAQIMLLFDRQLGMHFFDTQNGGSALLWQHLFWFFGHPEVYILALPAFGIISEVVPVFSRKVIFGYESVAAATVAIAFISLGVWAHHMFAVGLSRVADMFFSASLLIAVPTGIKMFNWIATMYGGRIVFCTPMLFATGFLAMFLIGGLSGIILGAVPLTWQLTDTYFVVAHFHYVIFGGTIFALLAATYYWFPKMTGKMLDERLGRLCFLLMFVGFNLTFFPMHIAGMDGTGIRRRIYTYTEADGWTIWNRLSTLGALFLLLGFLVFGWSVICALWRGKDSGSDPWDAWTLEWATTSPPAPYNFETVPEVRSRRPLWDLKHPDDPDWAGEKSG